MSVLSPTTVIRCLILALLIGTAAAQEPACVHTELHLTYPPMDAEPRLQVTPAGSAQVLPAGAACFSGPADAALWVTLAAQRQTSLRALELLQRFGAISSLTQVQYWSTTDQAWRPLVLAATAVTSAGNPQPRADFSAAELTTGPARTYRVTDSRTGAPVTYELQAWAPAPNRLVVQTRNLEPIRRWHIPLYDTGDLATLYVLTESAPGSWAYYSITRAVPATLLGRGHEKSYLNRALALFRQYLGLPTASEPPAAR